MEHTLPPVADRPSSPQPPQRPAINSRPSRRTRLLFIGLVLLLLGGAGVAGWAINRYNGEPENNRPTPASNPGQPSEERTDQASNRPDATKLPLGDNAYTTEPKKGYVFSCRTNFDGDAHTRMPWVNTVVSTWDMAKKPTIDGEVPWSDARWNVQKDGSTRVLSGNGLPVGHPTGVFPVASADDASRHGQATTALRPHDVNLRLPANPTRQGTPECVGDEVGIALTGVPIASALNADGQDAMAAEIFDECGGNSPVGGYYHYHGFSDCFQDTSEAGTHSHHLGYALDGFGIYGLRGEAGQELSSKDLDECHGHTHTIAWEGRQTEIYHYHLTRDFPYSVSCFRGKPTVKSITPAASTASRLPRTGDE